MPAKRTAPKSAKGRKASGRPAVRKVAVARKPDVARGRGAAHARKPAVPAKKPAAHAPAAHAPVPRPDPAREVVRAPSLVPPAPRTAAPGDGDGDESAEPGSLLAGPRNVQPYIVKRGELYMSKEQ